MKFRRSSKPTTKNKGRRPKLASRDRWLAAAHHRQTFELLETRLLLTLIPPQVQHAYGIDQISFGGAKGDGTGQTIAIVDAFDNPGFLDSTDPNFSKSDLYHFDHDSAGFTLPDPPSFKVVGQDGTNQRPAAGGGSETACDVEWAHAIAPGANIVLVEANSLGYSDLAQAITTAASLGSVVSMSFGGTEAGRPTPDPLNDGVFVGNVSYVACSGDNGVPGWYPAFSPNVLAAGATNLSLNGDNSYQTETGWSNPVITSATEDNGGTVTITTSDQTPSIFHSGQSVTISEVGDSRYDGQFIVTGPSAASGNTFTYMDPNFTSHGQLPASSGGTAIGNNNGGSGGGASSDELQPAYQAGVVPASMSTVGGIPHRTIPDVSFVGGMPTPVYIYDSSSGGDAAFFGTSLAAPCWAGLLAIANQGLAARGITTPLNTTSPTAGVQAALYKLPASDFHDVTQGNNGDPAGPGYDLVTGLGTPIANLLIPDLAGTSISYAVPTAGSPHELVLRKNGTNVELLDNGVVVASQPSDAITDVNITDANSSNDRLTVDDTFDGSFNARVSFNHTASSGYDTVEVNDPNGPSNNVTVSESQSTAGAGDITVGVALQAIHFQRVSEVDVNAGSGGDNISLQGNGGSAGLQKVHINGGAGNDTLTVDSTNGLFATAAGTTNGIFFNGGDGRNQLILQQGTTTQQTADVYSVGHNNGDGSDVITGPTGTQTVEFQNLAPVVDLVPAATLTVNGTPADNAINYQQGPNSGNASAPFNGATTGLVSIDNFESIEFANKSTLSLVGNGGNDTIDLNDPTDPDGLTTIQTIKPLDAPGTEALTVHGTGKEDQINYQNTGLHSVQITGAGPVTIVAANISNVVLDGNGGGDQLTVTTYNVPDPVIGGSIASLVSLTPGPTGDSGSLVFTEDFANTVATGIPLTFQDLGSELPGVNGQPPYPTLTLASGSGSALDSLIYNGTTGPDGWVVNDASTGPTVQSEVRLNQRMEVLTPGIRNLGIVDNAGANSYELDGPLHYNQVYINGNASGQQDHVELNGPTSAVSVTLNAQGLFPGVDAAQQLYTEIDGFGTQFGVLLSGIAAADMDVSSKPSNITLTAQDANEDITYTPTGPESGTFTAAGLSTVFTFDGTPVDNSGVPTGGLVVKGLPGSVNQVTLKGSTVGADLFRVLYDATSNQHQAGIIDASATPLAYLAVDKNVQDLNLVGVGAENEFVISPSPGTPANNLRNLVVNVDGGTASQNNALRIESLTSIFGAPSALAANQFVVLNRGAAANTGTVRTYTAGVQWPDINYQNVQVVSPNAASPANLLAMGPDKYEPNETRTGAADLDTAGNIQVSNATIFPNVSEFPDVPTDQDFYSVLAQQTGTLDFVATFNLYDPTLLPGGGQLDMQVLDAAGNVIANAAGGAAAFGAEGATANARIRIPVVAGQTYFVHVFGANANGSPNATVVNGYDLSVVNTPAIVPANLELSRSVPAGVAGSPDTGDLPPGAPGDDTGRSQFDNVTNNATPRIYLRLSDGIFLNDLPGNGTTDNPPVGVIPIPFSPNETTPGFRVAIFDGNNTQTPVGFASQVAGFPGLYEYDFTTPLADGVHNLTAEVQMVDPAKVTETGFGGTSASFSLTIDTVPPPVSFGSSGVANSGLNGASDSGVPGQPATIVDRITKVSTPTLYGVAEANSIVRLYDDLNGDGVVDAGDVFLGQATAIPTDGTNAFPNGQWRITSNVDLNNPNLGFPLDGLRNLLVTGEDLAGNVSAAQKLSIFVDTQGPTVNAIGITGTPGFPLFNTKLTPTPVASPTPLISSLDITFNDQPVRVGPSFVYPAVNPILATTTSNYALVGENNGIIPITSVTLVDHTTSGTPGITTVTLHFAAVDTPLPDDRYTLTISDKVTDNAGNALQGNFNGTSFPSGLASGNGSQGQTFVGSFTANSRAHIGNYSSGTVDLDINGNGLFDPQNADANNRDAIITMGYPTDRLFSGNFSTTYGANPLVAGTANGFQKLAAYGQDTSGNFRWLYDLSGTGGPTTSIPQPFAIDGLPVAGNFSGSPVVAGSNPPVTTLGDQVGLFDGKNWYLDVLDQGYISAADLTAPATTAHPAGKLTSDMAGLPFVGNFDGFTDLGTYQNGVVEFDLASLDPGHILTGQWNVKVNITNLFSSIPFNYVTARPLAGDLSGLGQESSLGFYVPGGTNNNPGMADWYFLEPTNSTLTGTPPIPAAGLFASGTVTTATAAQQAILQTSGSYFFNLMHAFKDQPLGGSDLFYQFGDQFALPLVGIWDPPGDVGGLTNGSTPSPTVAGTYVSNLYVQILGRQPSATDVAYWVSQLESGETPAQVAQFFATSNEYRSNQINQLYEQYLGRSADADGLAYWTGTWNSTGGPEQVQVGIFTSPEFFAAAQQHYPGLSADAAWITALYHDILNRDVDTADLSFWVNYLQSHSTASVVLCFVTSDEYRLDLTGSGFQTYLGRALDQASGQALLQQLQNGLTQDQLLTLIVSSDEYIDKP